MNNTADSENGTETVVVDGGDDESVGIIVGSIPLSLFLVMSILAALGVCYSLAFIFFNVLHRKKKIIKMTSPNVNVIILLGCCVAFIVIVLLGFSSPTIPRHVIPKTLQACVFLLPLSFTLVYGSLFAKVVRIHMIFTNLSFNGKSMRDEHLLLGVAALMLLDLAILLPWQLIDPITCHISTWKTSDDASNVTYAVEECSSELQVVWISVLYAYKVIMLSFGLYFTWQTRFVTLPSIRDARLIFASVQTVALLGLTVLPILLVTSESAIIKYSVGSLAIWLSLVTTMTFLFIPKARLLWMEMRTKEMATDSSSAAQMQFSESMTKTKNAASKCVRNCFFCCCSQSTDDNEDRYAQQILATEVETLKRTIREKDLTIRELTDRLYVGTEKFQQYLTTRSNRYDGLVWPQSVTSQQQRCNETFHECGSRSHCEHSPIGVCPSCLADHRSRNNDRPTRVNDPRQRLPPIPSGQLERSDELRNYRLSRYYREDEEEDEDYDSRSYSDGSCSTCAAADLLEMQMRDAELQRRRRMPADDGPRELSAATLSLSYEEAQIYTRGGVDTVVPRSNYHLQYPTRSASLQARLSRPVNERTPSAEDSGAYDNSPSSTESATHLVSPGHHRPTRSTTTRGKGTVEVRNYIDGHNTDPQIVGVFSVHRMPPTDEDRIITSDTVNQLQRVDRDITNPTPTMAVGLSPSTNHQTLMAMPINGPDPADPSATHHRLQDTVSPHHQINFLELNPLTVSAPSTSNNQNESSSSLRLVASDSLHRNGEGNTAQLATGDQHSINSHDGFNGIKMYRFMSVTQI